MGVGSRGVFRLGGGGGGKGGCERRIEVFVKIQKQNGGGSGRGGGGSGSGGGGGGGRVDVIEEMKFLEIHRKKSGGGQVGVGLVGGGVRVNVNLMLGVGGGVGYWGCEPRIKGIVQCTKRYSTILRKLKKCGGGGGGGAIFEPKTLSLYLKRKRKKK